jgi:hypothetical protein
LLARGERYEPVVVRGVVASDQSDEIEIRFEAGRVIAGLVVDAVTGEPIEGASVSVSGSQQQAESQRRIPLPGHSVRTAEGGDFVLNEVSRDNLSLYAQKQGYAASKAEIGPNERSDIVISLIRAGSISGVLIGVSGTSPEGGIGRLQDNTTRGTRSRWPGEDGFFEFNSLSAGQYSLFAESPDGRSNEIEFDLGDAESIDGLQLQMTPGFTLAGRISGLLTGETANNIALNSPERHLRTGKPDTAGNYEFKGMPAGDISVTVFTSKRRTMTKPVSLGESSVVNLDFNFQGASMINGRVTRGGEPAQGAVVYLAPHIDGLPTVSGQVSSDGFYSVEGLINGEYRLWVNGETWHDVTVNGSTRFDVAL